MMALLGTMTLAWLSFHMCRVLYFAFTPWSPLASIEIIIGSHKLSPNACHIPHKES